MEQYLEVNQTLGRKPNAYETKLAGVIEAIFAGGTYDLAGLVRELESRGMRAPDGRPWTEETFSADMAERAAEPPADDDVPAPETRNLHGRNTGPLTEDELARTGPRDRWYPVLPSRFVKAGEMRKVTRLGKDWLLFRAADGKLSMLADRCPHRNAPLSVGQHLGDRVMCEYHGVEVDGCGVVVRVPGMPGCSLEGKKATQSLEVVEAADAIFAFFPLTPDSKAPEFELPDRLADPENSYFLNYAEWNSPWRFYMDNVCDPMHGAFLHSKSHSMFAGDVTARFRVRETDRGFFFEKTDQKGVNFDWVEYSHKAGIDQVDLEIPYGPEGGPGGPFGIVGIPVPIDEHTSGIFHWRTRRVSGWERDVWRFMYKVRFEAKHWHVLEQDRNLLENCAPDADKGERLYQHDLGVTRIRKMYRALYKEQAAKAAAAARPVKKEPEAVDA